MALFIFCKYQNEHAVPLNVFLKVCLDVSCLSEIRQTELVEIMFNGGHLFYAGQ